MIYKKSKYGRGKHPNSRNNSHLFKKGHPNYGGEGAKKTQFKKGHKIRLGIEHTDDTKKKISNIQIGKKHSKNTKQKMSEYHKGNPHDGWFKKGHIPWNKDKKLPQYSGENHPNWQNGKSFEPYTIDFNEKFKEMIRERDNYCCVSCNKSQEECKEKLSVHHIDYIKINSFPQNCVSLCRNCHTPTNMNRNHWKTFFQSLLKERYNYEYTQDQKMILDFKNEVI